MWPRQEHYAAKRWRELDRKEDSEGLNNREYIEKLRIQKQFWDLGVVGLQELEFARRKKSSDNSYFYRLTNS